MTRDRVRSPVPHVCEHGLQFDHWLIMQLELQIGCVHVSVSLSGGHAGPLHAASIEIVRTRERIPLPHVTEHADQPVQPPTTHATGQQPKPQLTLSINDGHGLPPLTGCEVTSRVRVLVADVPHVAEHADHGIQLATTQSCFSGGHALSVHVCESVAPPLH
jgi:hypothetical protein